MNWMNVAHGNSFMPPQGTDVARQVDNLYSFLLIASLIACAILIGGMIYFVTKYKRQTNNDKTAYITHSHTLEFLWSFIPLVIFMGVFVWGWKIYNQMRTYPANSLEIHAYGKQWSWEFAYKSGKKSANELVVPVDQPVKLILTANDVIHSFYVPSFRIKQDAVPGRYTTLGFTAEKLGEFQVFCAEFCGGDHSKMLATIKVVPREDYEKWLKENDDALPIDQRGKKLFGLKGCVGCHSADGSAKVGPTLAKVFGKTEALVDGSVQVDEDYLRESILKPNAKIVKGFAPNVMPTFQGQLQEDELTALIEYIKTLK